MQNDDQKIKILIQNFNQLSLTLSTFLANVAPNSTFMKIRGPIESLVNQNSNKIIDMFVLKALKYEEHIMSGNDDFFMGKNYDDDLDKDNNKIIKVFEFKSIWGILNDQNKDIIKSYMKILCEIARVYFDTVCKMKGMK